MEDRRFELDARRSYRHLVNVDCELRIDGGEPHLTALTSISREGFSASYILPAPVGVALELIMPGVGTFVGRAVWLRDFQVGGEFNQQLTGETLEAILSADPDALLEIRGEP